MKPLLTLFTALVLTALPLAASVFIDEDAFGDSLGGWGKKKTAAEYPLSGATYRTYKPEISPTPDGGIFVSIRIDHVRGWLSSDDHAILEITFNGKGGIVSAQSTVALQGRSIKTDVITGGTEAGKSVLSPEGAVQVGTDLIADLSAKLLRENLVEAGRVSFPAVLRHNYNRLFQAVRVQAVEIPTAVPVAGADVTPPPPAPPTPPAAAATEKPKETTPATTPTPAPAPGPVPLEIKPFN